MHGEASSLQRCLNIHPIIHDVGDELGVGKRLIRPAHDAETYVLITAFHEGRNDGVKWTLARGKNIGTGGIEREQSSAVLQNKTHAADGDA